MFDYYTGIALYNAYKEGAQSVSVVARCVLHNDIGEYYKIENQGQEIEIPVCCADMKIYLRQKNAWDKEGVR